MSVKEQVYGPILEDEVEIAPTEEDRIKDLAYEALYNELERQNMDPDWVDVMGLMDSVVGALLKAGELKLYRV